MCAEDTQAGGNPVGSLAATAPAHGGASAIPVTLTFDQQVQDLTTADIQVRGGTVTALAGSGIGAAGTTWTFDVTPTGRGLVTVGIPRGAVTGTTGARNLPVGPLHLPNIDKS